MKISVIVPVYNVRNYIDECIGSIVGQAYSELEIILVDDGSNDGCEAICDAWAKRDERIRVFHKSNGGLMSAWKYGVRYAVGEYVGFVDSDDWIDGDMYAEMARAAKDSGADLICVALKSEYASGESRCEPIRASSGYYDAERLRREIFPYLLTSKEYKSRGLSPNRVTKLYRRDKLLRILDDCNDEVTIGEDLLTTFSFLKTAQSMYFIGDFYPYHYRINDGSMIQAFSDVKYQKIKELKSSLLRVNEKYGAYDHTTQIFTDFVDLYFRTVENEILTSERKGLSKKIKRSFSDPDVCEAVRRCDTAMLNGKTRLYLKLMHCNSAWLLVLIRRIKSRL